MDRRPKNLRQKSFMEISKLIPQDESAEEAKARRNDWCDTVFRMVDLDGDAHVTRKELLSFLRHVHLAPRVKELVSNHGYMTNWFAKLLLGSPKKSADKPIQKLIGIMKKHDVGIEKIIMSDFVHMWHDLMGKLYTRICIEIKVNTLLMVDILYLRCCMRWGRVEADLVQELLAEEKNLDLCRKVDMTEFAHIFGRLAARALAKASAEDRYDVSKVFRFIGVSLSDSTIVHHMHLDVDRYLLVEKKEGKHAEGEAFKLALAQWGRGRQGVAFRKKFQPISQEVERESLDYLRPLFGMLDDDGDNNIGVREFATFLYKLPMERLVYEFFMANFNAADADAGGTLELDEFREFIEMLLQQVFDVLDENKTGKLSVKMAYLGQKLLTGQRADIQAQDASVGRIDCERFKDCVLLALIKGIKLEPNAALPHFFCMVALVVREETVPKTIHREVARRERRRRTRRSSLVRSPTQFKRASKIPGGDPLSLLDANAELDVAKMRGRIKVSHLQEPVLLKKCVEFGFPTAGAKDKLQEYFDVVKREPRGAVHVEDFLDEYVRTNIFRAVVKLRDQGAPVGTDELLMALVPRIGVLEAKRHLKLLFLNISSKSMDDRASPKAVSDWCAVKRKQMAAFRGARLKAAARATARLRHPYETTGTG